MEGNDIGNRDDKKNLVPCKGIVWYPFIRGLYIGLGGGGV
jgi:hypothetical protein